MQIKKIEIENFRGISSAVYDSSRMNVFLGKNGSGKTSVLKAVIFALTGNIRDTDLRLGSEGTKVSIIFADGTTLTRTKKDGKGSVAINGRLVKKKAASKFLENYIGTSPELAQACLDTDYYKACSEKDLTNLFLKIMPLHISFTRMCEMSFLDDDEQEILCPYFPQEPLTFGFDEIAAANKKMRQKRAELKGEISGLNSQIPKDPLPQESLGSLRERLEEIQKSEIDQEYQRKKWDDYQMLQKQREQSLVRKKQLEAELAKLRDLQGEDPAAEKEAEKEKQQFLDAISRNMEVVGLCRQNIAFFQKTLENLNTEFCPLHQSLHCTTDRSGLKKELEQALLENQTMLEQKLNFIERCQKQVVMRDETIRTCHENQMKCQRRQLLELQLKDLQIPELPEEIPIRPEDKDLTGTKGEIRQKILTCGLYELSETARKEKEKKEEELETIEKGIALTDEKGIRSILLSRAVRIIEDTCNEYSEEHQIPYQFSIQCNDVISIRVLSEKTKEYVPLDELSGGEYIMSCLILSKIFNQVAGCRIFIADNMDRLDTENAECLLKALSDDDKYDILLLAGINHKETVVVSNRYADTLHIL